jgi:hypothetical protein
LQVFIPAKDMQLFVQLFLWLHHPSTSSLVLHSTQYQSTIGHRLRIGTISILSLHEFPRLGNCFQQLARVPRRHCMIAKSVFLFAVGSASRQRMGETSSDINYNGVLCDPDSNRLAIFACLSLCHQINCCSILKVKGTCRSMDACFRA